MQSARNAAKEQWTGQGNKGGEAEDAAPPFVIYGSFMIGGLNATDPQNP
jgi:hypothetical protein